MATDERVSCLKVVTLKDDYIFYGEDAENVFESIFMSGARGAEWSRPVRLRDGFEITFVLDNIISFSFRRGRP